MEGGFFSFAKQANHNSWLDLLRSLAIFLVLLRHGGRVHNGGLSDGPLSYIFSNGWVGVDLFFVLSGYLISKSLIRQYGLTGISFSIDYFRDRFLRIAPAYYVVLLLCVFHFFPHFQISSANLGQSLLAHILLLQDYSGSDINVVFWSLGVEEKFYLLAPILVALLLKAKTAPARALIIICLLVLSPIFRGETFANSVQPIAYPAFFYSMRSPFHTSLEGFVIGVTVALIGSSGWRLSTRAALAGFWAGSAVLLAWLASGDFYAEITRLDALVQPTAIALLFGFMLLCATALDSVKLRFEPIFRINARLSYALYLLHYPLIPLAFAISGGQNFPLFWASYIGLSYSAALLLHFLIEKPFLILKSRMKIADNSSKAVRKIGVLPS